MTWPFFQALCGKKHEDVNIFKDTRYTHGTHAADIARTQCLASQPEIVDTFKKVRGALGRFYPLIGSRMWKLWESICGRRRCELSCTAWTHGLGLQVEGGWWWWWGEAAGERAGRGLKKAEPEVWWAEWCMYFPPFALRWLVFSAERSDLLTLMG